MDSFVETIRSIFDSNPYDVFTSEKEYLFVYDDSVSRRTYMQEDNTNLAKSMQIVNLNRYKVSHICIDGGLIKYGLYDYVGDGLSHGRNDCMVYTDAELLLIELKMDVDEESMDKTRWGRYSDAMHQISDFYLYLKKKMDEKGHPIDMYYTQSSIHPIVCMKNPPKLSAQRNNEKEKFRIKTQLKIETSVVYQFV